MAELTPEQMARKAFDAIEVQNVFSRHEYFHQVGYHLKELDAIWVKDDGQYGKTASFGNNTGWWVGMEKIRKTYGFMNEENRKKQLSAVCKLHPEVKNIPENEGIGTNIMHTLTTPIIEVAGDGKTAKAMWYSPGQITEVNEDGTPRAGWMWERYGVDFVKEDGLWKIWHMKMYSDFMCEPGKTWADHPIPEDPDASPFAEMPEEYKMEVIRPNYHQWYPTLVPQWIPLPEPYETFSETFSYGP